MRAQVLDEETEARETEGVYPEPEQKKGEYAAGDSRIITLYMREIHHPVLSREQEQNLFQQLRCHERKRNKLEKQLAAAPTSARRRSLAAQKGWHARQADELKNQIITHNLRFVVKIARRYIHTLPLLEAIQNGNLGLMEAVDKFDPAKGYKFSTYATWWIRQRIEREAMNTFGTVRVPVHRQEKRSQFDRAQRALAQELGRKPTFEEMLGTMNAKERREMTDALSVISETVSIHSAMTPDGDVELQTVIPHPATFSPEQHCEARELYALLRRLIACFLRTLSKRDRRIVLGRFREDKQKLQHIGDRFKLTRERIRQIERTCAERFAAYLGIPAERGREALRRIRLSIPELKDITHAF